MNQEAAKADFLKNTQNHAMEVLKDDGVYRHLKFTNGGSQIYRYDLITWPGHLCISSDMGDYVFERLPDMFEFFRNSDEEHGINPSYWAEKCQSQHTNFPMKRYSGELFKNAVKRDFDSGTEDWCEEAKEELWSDIESIVLFDISSEIDSLVAINDFEYSGPNDHHFQFQDFWEHDLQEYTRSYLWCLHAIVWGIQKFDEYKDGAKIDEQPNQEQKFCAQVLQENKNRDAITLALRLLRNVTPTKETGIDEKAFSEAVERLRAVFLKTLEA